MQNAHESILIRYKQWHEWDQVYELMHVGTRMHLLHDVAACLMYKIELIILQCVSTMKTQIWITHITNYTPSVLQKYDVKSSKIWW